MAKRVYYVEVGLLKNKSCPEFEKCQIPNFYEQFGFYDEGTTQFTSLNKAIKFARKYVENGVNNTYVIVHTSKNSKLSIETTIYFEYKTQYGLINTITDMVGVI